eukprot:CAMPEP_0202466294 /NCGR_PEP_ID=MMETSP1360-20130828/68299_1 /ASSEMBLY_ACC=CAM_ASM_000848 /TAXON_ID=515479 /ORGANISM="Licmophora paradoxa, Strain CCMP2313" /LENGTH=57 /DNA_ID=CAMNT_0049090381 /DNA_START=299 /DNA_END=471 /DNA_ORIENTATION=-
MTKTMPPKKDRIPPDAVFAGKESDGPAETDGEGEADEEEQIAECQQGGIEKEEDAEK